MFIMQAGRLVEKCPGEVGDYVPALLEALMSTDWEYDWAAGLFGIGRMGDVMVYSDDEDDEEYEDYYEPNASDNVRSGAMKVRLIHNVS